MNKFRLGALLALLFFYGCAGKSINTSSLQKGVYLNDILNRYHFSLYWDSIDQVVTLSSDVEADIRLMEGSSIVYWGEREVLLDAEVKIVKSRVVVPLDFKQKILDKISVMPMVSVVNTRREKKYDKPKRLVKIKEIIIDPGHGGRDPGAISRSGIEEKDVVLDIALQLKKLLIKKGLSVNLTREDDTFISLARRTEIASERKAQLFVSIHANSSRYRNVSGLEVYSLKELDSLEKNELQRLENQRLLFSRLQMQKKSPVLENIISDMLYGFKRSQSDELADVMGMRTSRRVKTKNRGVKYARFFVLRNTLIPAVLVEVGFLSNPREEKMLRNEAYRFKIAQGLAQSILEYAAD